MGEASIFVNHNAEIAHRLTSLPGKCESIHGHSLQITLSICGQIDRTGVLGGLDFGTVKKEFRRYIDETYDHHLLLNEDDPWAQDLMCDGGPAFFEPLPGLVKVSGDPTTENIARWICLWSAKTFASPLLYAFEVRVKETNSNGAIFRTRPIRGFAG